MSDVVALENRVTRLETQISQGFDRLEGLLRNEISDLKNEQLSDLREQNRRLADDQRRIWEAVRSVETRENRRDGGSNVLSAIWHALSGVAGGAVALGASWFSSGHPPPH